MRLYNKKGWLNVPEIINYLTEKELYFCFILGGRGIGKTYGFLKYMLKYNEKILLLRRTQEQIKIISAPEYNPYKKLNSDLGCSVIVRKTGGGKKAYYKDEKIVAYPAALSTFQNLRGFDLSDVNYIIYDEFIPENGLRINNEYGALLNLYETVNRNRELEGKKPVYLIGLSNANNISNAIFIGLNIVNRFYKLQNSKEEIFVDKKRHLALIHVKNSPISMRKQKTVLYQLDNSNYSEMAINNKFKVDNENIKSMPLKEYKALVNFGELGIYKHKSNNTYYISIKQDNTRAFYTIENDSYKKFMIKYYYIYEAFLHNRMIFESYLTKSLYYVYNKL